MGIKLQKGINDFRTWCEMNGRMDLLLEWDYEKNIGLMPQDFFAHSNKDVYWICSNKHSYECSVDKRTSRNLGCPYCSNKKILFGFNDLLTTNPNLAEEWNYEKNKDLTTKNGRDISTPDKVTDKSSQRVWWKCRSCGTEWKTTPNDRVGGTGCPQCAKKKRSLSMAETLIRKKPENTLENYPELLEEWDYQKNDTKPNEILSGSPKRFWWICGVCGYSWCASANNRVRGSGCPKCKKYNRTSFPEQAIYYYLSQIYAETINGYTDIFQNKMELDIYIPEIKTAIEYDGAAFHSSEKAKKEMIKKYQICRSNGIRLLRVSEFENDTDSFDFCFLRKGNADRDLNDVITQVVKFVSNKTISVDVTADRAEIMKQYINVIHEKSISYRFPDVAKKWDIEKNNGLKPEQVNAYSNKKYWWICSLGHSYQATPMNEVFDTKTCPICSNHRVLQGFNDLETRLPDIAKEWNYEMNSPVTPKDVIYTSSKKFWWTCDKGHNYLTGINNRYYGKTGCPYCSNVKVLSGFNDLATVNPELVSEWNYSRNGNITPKDVLAGSMMKAWWICSLGHEWQTPINYRSGKEKTGCPYCSNHKVLTGFNDLATIFPDLLDEWDYEKNIDIKPTEVIAGSPKKVWWKCKTCGNEWETKIVMRTGSYKTGCPSCGYAVKMKETRIKRIQKDNVTLVSLFPDIAKEWDYEKNKVKPDEVSPGAYLKVWWLCPKGHSYQSWLNDKTGKHKVGCPICNGKRLLTGFNDLATLFPDIAEDWDYDKNIGITPSDITAHNGKKVLWKCSKGHSWEAIVSTRTGKNRTGCPFCSNKKVLQGYNDLETCFPELCKEWNYEKNDILPSEVVFGSARSVWWKCSKGHEWEAKIVNRTKGAGCQICYYNRKKLKVD